MDIDFHLTTSGKACGLRIVLANNGPVVAHHVCAYVKLPGLLRIDTKTQEDFELRMEGGQIYYEAYLRNVHKDLIRAEPDNGLTVRATNSARQSAAST